MFTGLGVFTDLVNVMIVTPWLAFVVITLCNPFVATYFAGWIFERRTVALWRGQSKSFFPGEAPLLLLGTYIVFYEAHVIPSHGWSWWLSYGSVVSLILASILLFVMRKIYDAPGYNIPGATANSATKLAHDIGGYFVTTFMLLLVGIPTLYFALVIGQTLDRILIIIAVVMIASWFVVDSIFDRRGIGHNPVAMHPDDSNCWYRRLQRKLQNVSAEKIRQQTPASKE